MVDWRAVARGTTVGLAVIVPVTIVRALLERNLTDLSHSAWIYPLSALVVVAYGLAGAVAARQRARGEAAPGGAGRRGDGLGVDPGAGRDLGGAGVGAGPGER